MISDQFEHLKMFSFGGEIGKTGVAEWGVPYSHIFISIYHRNGDFLLNTKNVP